MAAAPAPSPARDSGPGLALPESPLAPPGSRRSWDFANFGTPEGEGTEREIRAGAPSSLSSSLRCPPSTPGEWGWGRYFFPGGRARGGRGGRARAHSLLHEFIRCIHG